jgi:amino acid transporter
MSDEVFLTPGGVVPVGRTVQGIKDKPYGLKSQVLSTWETLGQSVANIAPTGTPTVVIPLVYAAAGNGTWLAYAIALVGILFVASSINQFAKRSASPGSIYTYITTGLGPTWGLVVGWSLLIAYIGCASSVTTGFTNYANVFLKTVSGHELHPVIWIAVSVLGAWFVAFKDIKLSARLALTLEFVSVAFILVVVALTLWRFGFHFDTAQLSLKGVTPTNLLLGLVLAIFSFTGFESAATLGSEANHPLKSIPRAILQSAIIVGVLFIFASYAEVLGFAGSAVTLDKSDAPLHVLSTAAGVPFLGLLIDLGAVISFFACVLASINAGARILFLLGRHGVFHSSVGDAHAVNSTPHNALTISAVLAFIPAAVLSLKGFGQFDIYGWIGTIATFGFIVGYIAVSIAAPVYLYRLKELKPQNVLVSVLGVAFVGIALVGSVYPAPPAPLNYLPYIFLGLLLVGVAWIVTLKLIAPAILPGIATDVAAINEQYSGGSGI